VSPFFDSRCIIVITFNILTFKSRKNSETQDHIFISYFFLENLVVEFSPVRPPGAFYSVCNMQTFGDKRRALMSSGLPILTYKSKKSCGQRISAGAGGGYFTAAGMDLYISKHGHS